MKTHAYNYSFVLLISLLFFGSCKQKESLPNTEQGQEALENTIEARIVSTTYAGDEGNYTFSVGISSPDTGCDQYADWWEVVTEDGELVYRRVLGHSHVNEQPFIRSGGPINIHDSQTIIVRAHMNEAGYGTQAYRGSILGGFESIETEIGFANDLTIAEPQPSGCAF